jgi:hypothetical protein
VGPDGRPLTPAQRRVLERAVARRERKLLAAVRRLQACLPALETTQRRVLVLRSGVGPGQRHSVVAVARKLDIRAIRVVRLERRGVRTLRQLDRATDCAPGAGPAPAGHGAAGLAGSGPPATGGAGAPTLVSTSIGSAGSGGDGHGGASQDTGPAEASGVGGSSGDQGAVAGVTASNPPAVVAPPVAQPGGGFDPEPILVPILAVLAIGLAARVTVRELGR